MVKKATQPLMFRVDTISCDKIVIAEGERMVRAPRSHAANSFQQLELEGSTEKVMAEELSSPLRLNRAKACKIKKSPISPPTVQRRLHGPVIIHTSPPEVIQVDRSNFMWLVQKLTGSSSTRSRCKKSRPQGADDLIQAQAETLVVECPKGEGMESERTDPSNVTWPAQKLAGSFSIRSLWEKSRPLGANDLMQEQTESHVECAIPEEADTELFLEDGFLSATSSDDEDSVSMQSNLKKAVPETPHSVPVIDVASPRSPLSSSSSLVPMIVADESNFTTFPASTFQFSSYPCYTDIIAEHFAMPILEPICDSFVCSFPFKRDSSFSSLSDLPLLSPSGLDGFTS